MTSACCSALLFTEALVLAWGCRSREQAGTAKQEVVAGSQHAQARSVGCEWGAFNEGTMTITLNDPAIKETCLEKPCDTTITINDHGLNVPGPRTDSWHPYLAGTTTHGDLARLVFSVARRWDVSWQSGESIRIRRVIRMTTCPGETEDQEITESATEIRDINGTLLMLSAPDVPLAAGGKALLAPGFGGEVSVSWTDLQCPAYQGPGVSFGRRRPSDGRDCCRQHEGERQIRCHLGPQRALAVGRRRVRRRGQPGLCTCEWARMWPRQADDLSLGISEGDLIGNQGDLRLGDH